MVSFARHYSVRYGSIGRFLIGCGIILLAACTPQGETPIRLSGEAQGTYYSIIYYDSCNRNLQVEIDSILTDFDQTASLWVEQSLVRRVNRNEDSVMNPLFLDLLQKSLWTYRYSNGAFDCTVGQLVNAWGFGFSKGTMPTDDTIELLRQSVGSEGVTVVSGNVLRKAHPETSIDFNAIAQGYSVDLIGAFLEQQGIHRYLIDIGGEVLARGSKAQEMPWQVGIERPAENKYRAPEVEQTIALRDQSVVTSGSYRKYYERNGVKYSHTIDPSTGHPVNHTLLSVSVVADSAWKADALATAFMVMGLDSAKTFIAQHPHDEAVQAVYFIYDEDGAYHTYATPQFRKLMVGSDENK